VPRKTRRPASPLKAALARAAERANAADPGQWGLNQEALNLPANAEVAVSRDTAGRTKRIQRQDIFDRLAGRGALGPDAVDAVRRLQRDLSILHRTMSGSGEFSPRIDVSRSPTDISEARAAAGARVAEALNLLGPRGAALIRPLCEQASAAVDWRAVILAVTGERLADAQSALLRFVCDELAAAYVEVDRRRRAQRAA
jgi:hypothetical protein